jgi:hypothetical protein
MNSRKSATRMKAIPMRRKANGKIPWANELPRQVKKMREEANIMPSISEA